VWSLWEISLSAAGFSRRRFLPVFATDDGRTFVPTAKRIWDLLLTEAIDIHGKSTTTESATWFDISTAAARTQGERLFSSLLEEHRARLRRSASVPLRVRRAVSGDWPDRVAAGARASAQATGREHQARMAALDDAEASVPDLNAVLMLRIGPEPGKAGLANASQPRPSRMSAWIDRILKEFTRTSPACGSPLTRTTCCWTSAFCRTARTRL